MRLRTKLPLFLIPLVIFPLLVVSWLAFERIRANAEENILGQMASLMQQISLHAETVDQTMRANATLFSSSSLLKDFIFAPAEDRYHFALLPLLNLFSTYHNAYPDYDEIRVILPSGFEDARFSIYNKKDNAIYESESPWFRTMEASQAATGSFFQWDPTTEAPTMVVAHRILFVDPTYEDSTAMAPSDRGYLVITANLNSYSNLIKNTRIGRSGGILILDPTGRPLYPQAQQLTLADPHALFTAVNAISNKEHTTNIAINNEPMLIQSRALPGGLMLIGYLPERELAQAGAELGRLVSIIGLISVSLSAGLLMLALQFLIVRPLNTLGAGAQAIGSGKLETRLPVTGHDEVADLANQFNTMAANLVESRQLREQAQAEALRSKEAAIKSLRETDRLKDEFLANTSHELRTPLHGITGIAESLLKGIAGQLPDVAEDNLLLIVSSARRLSNLVNDILDFSKLRHNALKVVKRPVDLKSAGDLVLSMVSILAEPKGLVLRNAIDANLPSVFADENRLHQILYNLIGNAVKFTATGSVTLEAFAQGALMHIHVADTGMGVPPDKRELIFRSFEQLDSGLDRAGSGTGLGLTITRQLIELHGGTIEVRDREGGGSLFAFTLPLSTMSQRAADTAPGQGPQAESPQRPQLPPAVPQAPDTQAARADADTPPASQPQDTRAVRANTDTAPEPFATGEHILVVDDEVVNLRVIENHLLLKGYTVSTATSGAIALEAIEKRGNDFNLILLDVMMPGQSGFEICELIRQKFKYNLLPIVFLTALTRDGDLERCFSLGGNDYIPKPFSYAELLARINLHLALSRQSRDLHTLNIELEKRVQDRTRALKRAYEDMERLANLDGLTGVKNRRALDQALEQAWSRSSQTGHPLSYLIADIDHFKTYNDIYGHQAGDACLYAVAQEIRRIADKYDGFIGRYGGEEFSLIVTSAADTAKTIAREICLAVASRSLPHAGASPGIVTISIGISSRSEAVNTPEDIIFTADQALYQAKQSGRNKAVSFGMICLQEHTPPPH
ncbi:MAG: diguanylate cyclase [Solidesulfovibrio sp. DCME]|uniref:diguanylate cyclase n=1 Tax=Solidesulfovibrio sp. DCME TaxID=3447380 RepID=UPI003D0EB465